MMGRYKRGDYGQFLPEPHIGGNDRFIVQLSKN